MRLFSKHFPYISLYCKRAKSAFSNVVVCSIGANIACCVQTFEKLFLRLNKHPMIAIDSTSYVYKNKAFGFTRQPDFYNASIVLRTNLSLRAIFSFFFYIERRFGRDRKRAFKNSSRSLDIDMIFYNNKKIRLNHLNLPHLHYKDRESVLYPLRFQLGMR